MNFFTKLTTPFVDVPVTVTDNLNGASDTLTVSFKRLTDEARMQIVSVLQESGTALNTAVNDPALPEADKLVASKTYSDVQQTVFVENLLAFKNVNGFDAEGNAVVIADSSAYTIGVTPQANITSDLFDMFWAFESYKSAFSDALIQLVTNNSKVATAASEAKLGN